MLRLKAQGLGFSCIGLNSYLVQDFHGFTVLLGGRGSLKILWRSRHQEPKEGQPGGVSTHFCVTSNPLLRVSIGVSGLVNPHSEVGVMGP